MDESMMKARSRLMDEFHQASSAEKWSKECVELIKNLLKSIYYIDVITAMEDGNEYPGSEHMPAMSYARGGQRRNTMGQYSRTGSYDNMPDRHYYDDSHMSGRRYYDDEMGEAVHKLERMRDSEMNPEKRRAIQEVLETVRMH